MKMVDLCVNLLRRVSSDLTGFNEGSVTQNMIDSVVFSLEIAYRELIVLDLTEGLSSDEREGMEITRNCLSVLRRLQVANDYSNDNRARVTSDGRVGRPMIVIPEQSLINLLDNHFTVHQIARMMGVSVSTLRRRMDILGLSVRALYSDISDNELDHIIGDIYQQFPTCGSQQMKGHLISRGHRIQQSRIRESLRRVDPVGTALCRLTVINRRRYSVPRPLSLFHVDGHHKLIRYVSLLLY